MLFFNTTLEKIKKMCCSKSFVFDPRSYTEVDDNLSDFMEVALKDWGVVKCQHGITESELKELKRQGLINYVKGILRVRINNYLSEKEDFKRRGVQLPDDVRLVRALRHEKEIYALLNMERPIEQELSYLTEEQRKNMGIDDGRIEYLAEQGVFNVEPDKVVVEDAAKEAAKHQKKKGGLKSFSELAAEA